MAKNVTAIYKDRKAAAVAVNQLLADGFSRDDVSVLMSDATRGREFAVESHSKAPEGAAVGAATGGVLGAVAAGLVAIGVIAAPGIGLVAAGPIVAALAGAGAGGAVGSLAGSLVGMGLPEHEAKLLADEIKEGSFLIGVHAHDDRADAAKKIFEETGGKHIHG